MEDFIITSETTTDLTWEFADSYNIRLFPMSFYMDGFDYEGTRRSNLSGTAFYEKMRKGAMPTTDMVSIKVAEAFFEQHLMEASNIVHIAFSSSLSGSYDSFKSAAHFLNTKYKSERVVVIDSKCACSGEGLLVYLAASMKARGANFEETVAFVSNKAKNIYHYFTVDDLNHLQRGGRISRAKAFFGNLVGAKPLLCLDTEGKIAPVFNPHGRKAALKALVDKFGQHVKGENDLIFINHADCLEDALSVKNEIRTKYGYKNFEINFMGPIIGAHAGPGALALFFLGENRANIFK